MDTQQTGEQQEKLNANGTANNQGQNSKQKKEGQLSAATKDRVDAAKAYIERKRRT